MTSDKIMFLCIPSGLCNINKTHALINQMRSFAHYHANLRGTKTKVNHVDTLTHSKSQIQTGIALVLGGMGKRRLPGLYFDEFSSRLKAFPCLSIRFSCYFIELFRFFWTAEQSTAHRERDEHPSNMILPHLGSFARQMTRICLSGVRNRRTLG